VPNVLGKISCGILTINLIKMIQDTQEYLQHWEKENNPFYPKEMRWDRLQVNRFLKDYKQQLILPVVMGSNTDEPNWVDECGCGQMSCVICHG